MKPTQAGSRRENGGAAGKDGEDGGMKRLVSLCLLYRYRNIQRNGTNLFEELFL